MLSHDLIQTMICELVISSTGLRRSRDVHTRITMALWLFILFLLILTLDMFDLNDIFDKLSYFIKPVFLTYFYLLLVNAPRETL